MAEEGKDPKEGEGSGTEQTIPYARFQEVNTRAQTAEAKVLELQKLLEEGKGKDDRIAALEKELKDTKDG